MQNAELGYEETTSVQNQRGAQRSGSALARRSDEAERMPAVRQEERSVVRDDEMQN